MNKSNLVEYEHWKSLNEQTEFNLFDYFYMIKSSKSIHSDLIFAFSEIFWPTFVNHDGLVFLKENFCLNKYSDLHNRKLNPEFWINLLTIDPFFEGDQDKIAKSKMFGKILLQAWTSKLKLDFPDRKFSVENVFDDKSEDFGITFFQNRQID